MIKEIITVPAFDLLTKFRVYQANYWLRKFDESACLIPAPDPESVEYLSKAINFFGAKERRMSVEQLLVFLGENKMPTQPALPKAPGFSDLLKSLNPNSLIDARRPSQEQNLTSLQDSSVLIAIGESGLLQCAPYSLLTNRRIVLFEDLKSTTQGLGYLPKHTSLLFGLGGKFSYGALDSIFKTITTSGSSRSAGFFYPCESERLESRSLKLALFYLLFDGARTARNFIILSDSGFKFMENEEDHFLLGRSSLSNQITETISRKVLYTFVSGHSNGVDMDLGNVVLCTRQDHADRPPSDRSMPCFSANLCIRKTARNTLSPVSIFRSDILFLENCFGVYLDHSFYDLTTSISYFAAHSPTIGAFIGTPGSRVNNPADGFRCMELLDSGMSLGQAVADINKTYLNQFGGVSYPALLFGDPEIILPKPSPGRTEQLLIKAGCDVKEILGSLAPEHELETVPANFFCNLSLFRTVLCDASDAGVESLAPCTDITRDHLDKLWAASLLYNKTVESMRSVGVDTEQLVKNMGQSLVNFQSSWFQLFRAIVAARKIPALITNGSNRYYEPLSRTTGAPTQKCPYCFEATIDATKLRLPNSERIAQRHTLVCLNCGPIFDSTAGISNAWLVCPSFCQRTQALNISVNFGFHDSTIVYMSSQAVLDPPFPSLTGVENSHEAIVTTTHDLLEVTDSSLNTFTFAPLTIPASLTPGGYMLNIGILLNAEWALLRRMVYITA